MCSCLLNAPIPIYSCFEETITLFFNVHIGTSINNFCCAVRFVLIQALGDQIYDDGKWFNQIQERGAFNFKSSSHPYINKTECIKSLMSRWAWTAGGQIETDSVRIMFLLSKASPSKRLYSNSQQQVSTNNLTHSSHFYSINTSVWWRRTVRQDLCSAEER